VRGSPKGHEWGHAASVKGGPKGHEWGHAACAKGGPKGHGNIAQALAHARQHKEVSLWKKLGRWRES
jgi:hypothetical protein